MIGGGGCDLSPGRAAAFRELLLGPAAGDDQPASLGRGLRRRADAIERLGK
jgi:hypothetical protein